MSPTSLSRRLFPYLLTVLLLMIGVSSMMPLAAAPPLQPRAADLKIGTGWQHTCGIHFDDLLQCWGANDFGQTDVPVDLGTVSVFSVGYRQACAIKSDNTLHCWGDNTEGQTDVPADLGTVNAVSTETGHTCAVKTDNTLRCWGDNSQGNTDVPVDLGTVSAVSAGYTHTCAVKTDATLRCWGDNSEGQTTVPIDLGTVSAVSVGRYHTCAVKTDATLRCWGYNTFGQIDVPVDLGTVNAVSAREYQTCAVKSDATVRCWGRNDFGQTNVPVDLGTVSAVSAGRYYTCAVRTDNSVHCWGDNDTGDNNPPAPLVTIDLSGSPLAEAGGVATITVDLSDYSWTNVEVNLGYSGTASGVDYQASTSVVLFNTTDLTGSVSLTGVEDTLFEGDETIIVDIDTITGGIENGIQQVTAIVLDDDPPPATATEPPVNNLIDNGGFENDLASWVVKNGSGDTVKCDKPDKVIAYSGDCAFRFKGGAGENSRLQQILDLTGVTFVAGDTLQLGLYLNAANPAISGKVKMVVKYTDDTAKCKISLPLVVTVGYELLNSDCTIDSSAVDRIKFQVKNLSAVSKMYVDAISVVYNSPDPVRLLPLP